VNQPNESRTCAVLTSTTHIDYKRMFCQPYAVFCHG